MNNSKKNGEFAATVAGPGDFPLGSVESRATARSWLTRITAYSQYDEDCALIHSWVGFITARLQLPIRFEESNVWKRGVELAQRGDDLAEVSGPVLHFIVCEGREPQEGERWSYSDVRRYSETELPRQVAEFEKAWQRLFLSDPCPYKWENGALWLLENGARGPHWERDANAGAEAAWWWVLYEAEKEGAEVDLNCSTIQFVRDAGGKLVVRAADSFPAEGPRPKIRSLLGFYAGDRESPATNLCTPIM